MQLFYAPDITLPRYVLGEEESRHCVRVLRLGADDELHLTDGRGNLYRARVADPDQRHCVVEVVETIPEFEKRGWELTMAVAPTKNIERFEWFLEKAIEVGVDRIVPLLCARSERRVIKPEREEKVITSAVKQSLKAYHPVLEAMTPFRELVERPFDGVKLIAHCDRNAESRKLLGEYVRPGDAVLILIGPEGDFTPEEVTLARQNGFRELSLGQSRLRTETAAVAAVISVAFINQ